MACFENIITQFMTDQDLETKLPLPESSNNCLPAFDLNFFMQSETTSSSQPLIRLFDLRILECHVLSLSMGICCMSLSDGE